MRSWIKYLSLFILLATGVNAQVAKYFQIDTNYLKVKNTEALKQLIEADRKYDSIINMLQTKYNVKAIKDTNK